MFPRFNDHLVVLKVKQAPQTKDVVCVHHETQRFVRSRQNTGGLFRTQTVRFASICSRRLESYNEA